MRERQLQPVRGTPSARVEENQRERLYAAMVACVAKQGFAATTVSDLTELSGVSSRSFYDLFGDKSTCLLATVEEMVGKATRVVAANTEDGDEDLETLIARLYRAFASTVATQPAAAKVCLTESLAAGPAAFDPIERAIADYEKAILRRYAVSPERIGMPAQMVAARMGGIVEVARARLRLGTEAELATFEEDILALILADRPPPQPLRLGVRPQKAETESVSSPDHADRAIRAFFVLVDEQGYPQTTVDQVVKRASMSARTFYANFKGKEDLLMAAIDSACAQGVAAVTAAFTRHPDWPDAVRAGIGALLNFLASRPGLAKLMTVEVYAAGEEALERRAHGLAPIAALIEANTVEWAHLHPVIYETLAGGVYQLLRSAVIKGGADSLPALTPVCTYLTLAPFIGADTACAAANGDRGDAEDPAPLWSLAPRPGAIPFRAHLTSAMKAMAILERKTATAPEIAEETGEDPAVVSEYMGKLASISAVVIVSERDGETVYGSEPNLQKHKILGNHQAATMSPQERADISEYVWQLIRDDVEDSLHGGPFDVRLDRILARSPMTVDEAGWREMIDLHAQMIYAGFQVQARSTERMKDSGESGFKLRSMQALFEPKPDDDER
ncbi:MAG TPA: TetR/AcrR family transcriptional regulator [Solirubrobacterales bacterium]